MLILYLQVSSTNTFVNKTVTHQFELNLILVTWPVKNQYASVLVSYTRGSMTLSPFRGTIRHVTYPCVQLPIRTGDFMTESPGTDPLSRELSLYAAAMVKIF